MRILHVSDCYLPRLGGIEVQVAELVRMQREAGHEVAVATATRGEPLPGVRRIVAKLPFEIPAHPRGVSHLTRLMTAAPPDVVHVHMGAVSPFAWQGVRAAVRIGLPVVVTVHSMWDPVTQALYRALRLAYGWQRWGLVGTTVSTAAAVPIRAVAGRGVPVHVISNGLDLSGWRAAPPGERDDSEVRVVAVGRLAPRKQPVRLLRLLREARSRLSPEIRLRATVIGDGPARASMLRYLDRNGMSDWVELPGRLSRERIAETLAAADLFVAPAPRESFGLAALEARAAGLPVVARTQSGVADFVEDGVEGLLGSSFDGLVDAVVRLAGEPELRKAIAAHNRSAEPSVGSWPQVLDGFERCYRDARKLRNDATP